MNPPAPPVSLAERLSLSSLGVVTLCASLTLSLSPRGDAVNNAGGLADLCEPAAWRRAGVPGGDTQKKGADECSVRRAVPYRSPGCLDDRGWMFAR